ncbi:MAG: SfnB family sulfur acquisition oxidoreductase, partial [Paraburkholderia nemoris]
MAEFGEAASSNIRDESRHAVRVITDDAQAIAVAHELAGRLAQGAAARDTERRLPHEEIEWFSQSGLWAITVPKAYGG